MTLISSTISYRNEKTWGQGSSVSRMTKTKLCLRTGQESCLYLRYKAWIIYLNLLQDCLRTAMKRYFSLITRQNITIYLEKSLETRGSHFVLCNPLFWKVKEVYFKIGNIVILMHSIWNNKIFLQQIREDRVHDELSLKKGCYFFA